MKKNSKHLTHRLLYQLFSRLADWSGGWRGFVMFKLMIGAILLAPQQADAQQLKKRKQKHVQAKQQNHPPTSDSTNVFCYVAEQMPMYKGGDESLLNFIYRNLNIPHQQLEKRKNGTVVIRFEVSEQGRVQYAKVIKSLNPTCDAEALRVVKLMPDWIPSTQNGKAIKVSYTLPIKFDYTQLPHDSICDMPDIAPEFPGGEMEMFAYLAKNIRTNDIPFEMCYSGPMGGTVFCRFIVEKDGSLSHLQVLKSLDHEFDAMALDVIAQMPKWKPASLHHKTVRAYYTLPVRFKLE